MSWYLLAWRKCFDFNGRAQRKAYWYFALFYALGTVFMVVLDLLLGTCDPRMSLGWLTIGYLLASLLPMLAVSARRLHDIGRSAWWLLLNLLPGLGSVTLSVTALFDSQPGSNAYGLNPEEELAACEALAFPAGKHQRKSLLVGVFKIAAMVVAVTALFMGAAWVWWQKHSQEFLASGQVHREKGMAAGRSLEEAACVGLAVDALGAEAGSSVGAGIANSVELSGCLETSRATPGFCDGVPVQTEIFATGQWVASVCEQIGHGGNTSCNILAQRIATYCSSDKKLHGG